MTVKYAGKNPLKCIACSNESLTFGIPLLRIIHTVKNFTTIFNNIGGIEKKIHLIDQLVKKTLEKFSVAKKNMNMHCKIIFVCYYFLNNAYAVL